MRSKLLAGFSAAVFVLSMGFIAQGVASAEGCPVAVSFVVGGTGDPGGRGVPFVPAGERVNIVYPASISPFGGFVSGDESIRIGSASLSSSVASFRARCPDSKVNITGFSLGAVVVSDVCDGLRGAAARNVTCTTVGNPKRQGSGVFGNLASFIPGFHFNGNRVAPVDGPRIVEICNPRDLYCAGGNPWQDPGHFIDAAVGTFLQGQHGYPAPVVPPVVPSTPVPVDMPSPYGVFEPVMSRLVRDAPVRLGGPYVPTPVGDYLPPIVESVLPREVAGFVLPPLPAL